MAEMSLSTYLSIQLFSDKCTLSPTFRQSLIDAICADLSQLILTYEGILISEQNLPIVFQFNSKSSQTRSDLFNASQAALYILHRLAEFRLTRQPDERSQWQLRFGICADQQSDSPSEKAEAKAFQLSKSLSLFALNDQIVIDHLSFETIQKEISDPWILKELETSYAQTSQILYHKKSPDLVLSPELKEKSYQLSCTDLSQEDSLCFYYIGLIPFRADSAPLPVLRLYSPKSLPCESTDNTQDSKESNQEMTLGRYTLKSVLGVGGMGQVWRALDTFGNSAALKMMLPGNASTEGQIERFQREAKIMSKLPHHNICRIFEVGETKGVCYIAMELVEGLTLHELLHLPVNELETKTPPTISTLLRQINEERARLKNEGQKPNVINRVLPLEITLSIVGKMCDAIQFAHDHNILHRDLKPGNIMIREDGEPVVMDFGLGKLDTDEKGKDLHLTMEGAMLGTMQYMSPEQAMSSHTVDSRADVYSIGAILYEMLTGQHHFAVSGSLLQDAQKLQDYHPPRLSTLVKSIEKDLEMVVLKALHPEPDRRYRTPAALRADLERYLHGEAVTAKPVTFLDVIRRMYRRNKPVTIVSIASIFALIVFAAAGYIQIKEEKLAALAALQAKTISEQNEKQKTLEALEATKMAKLERERALQAAELAKQATALAKQRLAEAEEALMAKERAENERKEALELAEKATSDAQLNENILAKKDEQYQMLVREKELLTQEYKKNLEKKPEAENALSQEQIQMIIANELPKIKREIRTVGFFDPMFNVRILRALTNICSQSPHHIEPSFLIGKVYFSNGNFTESFNYFTQIIEKLKTAKDSNIQSPIANQFFSILQSNINVDRDFFDETKGTVRFDFRSLVDAWKTISPEDDALAKRFNDPNGKLNQQDRVAFLRFFSILEKNPQ